MKGQMTPAQRKRWFDSAEFEQQYHFTGYLGTRMDESTTYFSLWAPTADRVQLNLYPDGNNGELIRSIDMQKTEKGVWQHWESERLDGVYYDYAVTAGGETHCTQDPYARACGVNGKRSMVVDLSNTNPDGWEKDQAPARTDANIIYEIHVKDFSWDANSGVPESMRGKYAALTLDDTTYQGKGECATCLNHAKKLGVTHIQLMPVYDFGSVDETGTDEAFNWGYDPVNYNVPEGSYSSNPFCGDVRIRELKEAILSMHRAGFRVIMDVVYNHTYYLNESCLFRTVPWYFYRQDEEGMPSNGSGCGSEIASERSMVSRYIMDSLMYWAEEYHFDGFRFDLMGMLDTGLMNRIQEAMDTRFGRGEKLLYGEPWAGGACNPRQHTELAHKGNMKRLHSAVGAFCDNTRDCIKGSVMDEASRGFVNGGGLDGKKLACCIRAWAGEWGEFAAPSQTITYLSSHDDWTLWDKLTCTLDQNRCFTGFDPGVLRANRLAFAMLSCCQGHLFMLSGEEFGRTKEGIKNSYNSPVTVNRMDWKRCRANRALVEYYRGLIALRKKLPALKDLSATAGNRILKVAQMDKDTVSILLDNHGNSSWDRLLLIFNAGDHAMKTSLPCGQWRLLADGENSFHWQGRTILTGTLLIPANSALILGKAAN